MLNITLAPPSLNVVLLFLFPGRLLEFSSSWTKRRWCMHPSGNWIPFSKTFTALCSICMAPSSQGSRLWLCNCLTNQGTKVFFIQKTVFIAKEDPTQRQRIQLGLFWYCFFFFNQVVLPQTSTARAESEFLPIVSFSPLKNNCLMHDFNKNRIWLCQRNDGRL